MDGAVSLPLATWLVLLGPMPLVFLFALAGYLLTGRHRRRRDRR